MIKDVKEIINAILSLNVKDLLSLQQELSAAWGVNAGEAISASEETDEEKAQKASTSAIKNHKLAIKYDPSKSKATIAQIIVFLKDQLALDLMTAKQKFETELSKKGYIIVEENCEIDANTDTGKKFQERLKKIQTAATKLELEVVVSDQL